MLADQDPPAKLALPLSGPNFRRPPRRNFQDIQLNSICDPESEYGSEDESEEVVQAQKGKIFQSRKLAEPRRTIKRFQDPALEKQKKVVQGRRNQQNILKLQKLRMQPDFTV